jgi:hypothetical protein
VEDQRIIAAAIENAALGGAAGQRDGDGDREAAWSAEDLKVGLVLLTLLRTPSPLPVIWVPRRAHCGWDCSCVRPCVLLCLLRYLARTRLCPRSLYVFPCCNLCRRLPRVLFCSRVLVVGVRCLPFL